MVTTPIENNTRYLRKTISDLSEQLDLLAMLQNFNKTILSKFHHEEILSLFLDIVNEIVHYEICILYLFDKDEKKYHPVRYHGVDKKKINDYEPEAGVISWAMEEDRWTHVGFPEEFQENKNDSITILPLLGAQKKLGFLLMSFNDLSVFNQANMYLLSFVTSQTCIAIENQGLYEQLRQSHEYIHNIVESINNGIITIDIENRITLINKNATAILGITSGDIIGLNYSKALPSGIISVITRLKRKAIKSGFALENIIEYSVSNGLNISIAINASLLNEAHGNRIGVIFVLRDMSASKELERLRQIDEIKSDFVSNISHELRTPLGIVKSYIEAILNQVDPSDYITQREFLHVVNSETDRLTELVDVLLDISRIESDKFEIELNSVSLTGIIESAIEQLEKQSAEYKIVVDLPPTLPEILADHDKLLMVFVNVIDNAIKFSPEGGTVRVEVSVKSKMISCSVSDEGIGISKKDISLIFDKFYRGSSPEVADIPGTGLGLSLVKHIIEVHKGKIKVKSSPGKGTTFIIQLPYNKYES